MQSTPFVQALAQSFVTLFLTSTYLDQVLSTALLDTTEDL